MTGVQTCALPISKVLELTSLENSEKKLELERSLINKAVSMITEN